MRVKTFFIIFFLFLFLPLCFALADSSDTEIDYPDIPGLGGLSEKSSIPEAIRYLFNLVFIFCILAVIFSLIYGGFKFLTAAGDPGAMTSARKQMFGSGVGLLILIGSYILLLNINPQLLILRIKRPTAEMGAYVLNEAAFNDYQNNVAGLAKNLDDLLEEEDSSKPQAKQLKENVSDVKESFGFDFKIGAFYIFPGTELEVFSYKKKDFEDLLEMLFLPECESPVGPKFGSYDLGLCVPEDAAAIKSIKVAYIFPGVYLYQGASGELNEGVAWFPKGAHSSLEEFKESKSLGMRNISSVTETMPDGTKKLKMQRTHDFIAVLYDKVYYFGEFRIFFEYWERNGSFAGNITDPSMPINIFDKNKPDKGKVDEYGRVTTPSSMQIEEIDPSSECEVEICANVNYRDCYAYVMPGKKPRRGIVSFEDTIPIYKPQDLPRKINVDRDEDGKADIDPAFAGPAHALLEVPLENNVRSLRVTGRCMLVLFERRVDDWPTLGPGSHSQAFIPTSDVLLWPVLDVGVNPIYGCNCTGNPDLYQFCDSCASSIAIYPIK